jgi:hypothetical protein
MARSPVVRARVLREAGRGTRTSRRPGRNRRPDSRRRGAVSGTRTTDRPLRRQARQHHERRLRQPGARRLRRVPDARRATHAPVATAWTPSRRSYSTKTTRPPPATFTRSLRQCGSCSAASLRSVDPTTGPPRGDSSNQDLPPQQIPVFQITPDNSSATDVQHPGGAPEGESSRWPADCAAVRCSR